MQLSKHEDRCKFLPNTTKGRLQETVILLRTGLTSKYRRPPTFEMTEDFRKEQRPPDLQPAMQEMQRTEDRARSPPHDQLDTQSTKTKVPVLLEAENETTKDNPPSFPPRSHKCL